MSLGWPTPHHLKNMQYFVELIKKVKLEQRRLWHLMMSQHSSPQCCGPLHCHSSIQTSTGPTTLNLTKDWHVYPTNSHPVGVLPQKHILPLPRWVLWTGPWCSHGFPNLPPNCQPVHGRVQSQGHQLCPTPTSYMALVCRWNLCYPTGKTLSTTSPAYQFTGPTHSVHHGGPQWQWCLTLPGHDGFPTSQKHFDNHSVQESNT